MVPKLHFYSWQPLENSFFNFICKVMALEYYYHPPPLNHSFQSFWAQNEPCSTYRSWDIVILPCTMAICIEILMASEAAQNVVWLGPNFSWWIYSDGRTKYKWYRLILKSWGKWITLVYNPVKCTVKQMKKLLWPGNTQWGITH